MATRSPVPPYGSRPSLAGSASLDKPGTPVGGPQRTQSSLAGPGAPRSSAASPPPRGGALARSYAGPGPSSAAAAAAGLTDRVHVFARVRPPLEPGADLAVRCDGPACQVFVGHRERSAAFTFDGVFGPSASQGDVYAAVAAPLVSDVLDGYEGAVLAYGQTGSGKTHSLLSTGGEDGSDAGLFPRLAADVFAAVEADFRNVCTVEVAFCQIYNEQVDDLLRPAGVNLKVRSEGEGAPAVVDGLHFALVPTAAALLEAFRAGRRRLVYAETVLNMHSSRSHALLQLRITKTSRPKPEDEAAVAAAAASAATEDGRAAGVGDDEAPACAPSTGAAPLAVRQLVGRLWVVDLAGSERVKKSAAEGQRLREATNINSSLLALGNCVAALAQRAKHVPYRDSNLTRLLEPALCGRARCALLACVAPEEEHAGEGIGALEFAARAMRIATAPQQNASTLLLTPAQLAAALGRGATDSALAEHGRAILRLEGQLERAEAQKAMAQHAAASREHDLAQQAAQQAEAADALRRRAERAEAELRQAQAAREFFAAAAAAADAARAEAVAAAEAARDGAAAAAAAAAEAAAAAARDADATAFERESASAGREAALEAALAESERLRAAAADAHALEAAGLRGALAGAEAATSAARAAAAAAAGEADAARAVAASTAAAVDDTLRSASGAYAAHADALRGDAAAAAAAAASASAAAASAEERCEALRCALLAVGVGLQKRGRRGGGKAQHRLVRVRAGVLEWASTGAGPWRGAALEGASVAPEEPAAAARGLLVVRTPAREVALLLAPDNAGAQAWGQALRARLRPPVAAPPVPPPRRTAGPAPPPPVLPASVAALEAAARDRARAQGAAAVASAGPAPAVAPQLLPSAGGGGGDGAPAAAADDAAKGADAAVAELTTLKLQRAASVDLDAPAAYFAAQQEGAEDGPLLSPSLASAAAVSVEATTPDGANGHA